MSKRKLTRHYTSNLQWACWNLSESSFYRSPNWVHKCQVHHRACFCQLTACLCHADSSLSLDGRCDALRSGPLYVDIQPVPSLDIMICPKQAHRELHVILPCYELLCDGSCCHLTWEFMKILLAFWGSGLRWPAFVCFSHASQTETWCESWSFWCQRGIRPPLRGSGRVLHAPDRRLVFHTSGFIGKRQLEICRTFIYNPCT